MNCPKCNSENHVKDGVKEDPEDINFYYLKDHLGSIRAVIDEDNIVVSAQDGACPALDAGTCGVSC